MQRNSIVEQFEFVATRFGAAIAVREDDRRVAYDALNTAANRIAHGLLGRGLQPRDGAIVGLFMEPGIDYAAGLLGVAKAGAAFLPLPCDLPERRLAAQLEKAAVTHIVTDLRHRERLAECLAAAGRAAIVTIADSGDDRTGAISGNPGIAIGPADPCYVMFTSGSTGAPKAILGQHRGLSHFLRWEISELALDEHCRGSWLAPTTFDVSLRDILVPLMVGGTLCVPAPETRVIPHLLADWLAGQGATLVHIVPTLLRLLTRELARRGSEQPPLPALRHLLVAGEPLFGADIAAWHEAAGNGAEVFNLYGPSETTLAKVFHRTSTTQDDRRKVLPIGKPLPGAEVLILNGNRLCRPNEIGEIHIRTAHRSLGYLDDPALTASVFVPNPLTGQADDIVYKTGDLGRYSAEGLVECLGRMDGQVKINGVRIELGEIEAALRQIAGIDQAVAAVHSGGDANPVLVGYYTTEAGAAPAQAAIEAELQRQLPAAMLPHLLVPLAELPRTVSGKVNRKALPKPEELLYERLPFAEPEGEVETAIAGIWRELFGLGRVSAVAGFRDLGGDSLKAIRATMRIWEEFGVDIALREIIGNPTVRSLAAIVATRAGDLAIVRQPDAPSYPASSGQARLWRLDRMGIAPTAYNLAEALLLDGPIDAEALERGLAAVVARHESLRTTFLAEDDQVRQLVHDSLAWRLETVDLSRRADAAAEADRLAEANRQFAFDLAHGPLFRLVLVNLPHGADGRVRSLLLFNIHHIICDLWSLDLLFRELAQAYAGQAPSAAPPLQYRDFVMWQQSRVAAGEYTSSRLYWLERLRGLTPLQLPTDRPRPSVQRFQGTTARFRFDPAVSLAMAEFAERRGVTPFVVLAGLLAALLHRYSGQGDVAIGMAVAGRSHPSIASVVGYFANTVVLRETVDPAQPVEALLSAVAASVAGALEHQHYPFDALVEELAPVRDMSRSPLFDVMIIDHAFESANLVLDGVRATPYGRENAWGFSRYDLVFHFQRDAEGVVLDLNYNTDLFDAARITRAGGHFQELARAAVLAPDTPVGDLPILTGDERDEIARYERGPESPWPGAATIPGRLAEIARASADRPALIDDAGPVGYAALSAATDRAARRLVETFGVATGDRIAVLAERSALSVMSMLAVMKAGAVYVPIDQALPPNRIAAMLRSAQCTHVIGASERSTEDVQIVETAALFAAPETAATPFDRSVPGDVAYVIFTSGSTGEPRAVMVEHAGVVNMAHGQIDAFGLDANDRVVQFASPSFDASIANMLMALLAGGTVLLPPVEVIHSAPSLLAYLGDSRATVITLPPTYLRLLDRTKLAGIRVLISAGEPAPPEEMQHYAGDIAVFNAYGPSEFSVCATVHAVRPADGQRPRVPIGRPLPNTSLLILDNRLRPVPAGIDGEIFLGGAGVARGYQNDASATAAKFITHPETGERLYRTGDLGRWLDDGTVDFLGRRDDQVKVSGHRIELGEVEQAMRAVAGVGDCHVATHQRDDGSVALVGYFVPARRLELWPSIAEFFVYDDVTYGSMAGDEKRNQAYRAAFARHLEDKIVVDIGTGPLAILARLAIEAGARKVYAVDILERTAAAAKANVAKLGLSDRIEVLCGDAATIDLPEPADWCISEIVGAIGGSEGAAAIINDSRRLLRNPANMLPRRSLTAIAAVSVPEAQLPAGFSDIAAHYVERIFAETGRPFDLRLCLKNFSKDLIVSDTATFEDLDYTRQVPLESRHEAVLRIDRSAEISGFLVWLRLYVDDDQVVDILDSQGSWLPIYLPALPDGAAVEAGDCLRLTVERRLCFNRRNPDFRIFGTVERPGRTTLEVAWDSPHIAEGFRSTPFYRRVFADGPVPRASELSASALRGALGEILPAYAVPAFLLPIEQMPMTVNGKVDRTRLPAPKASPTNRVRLPRNPAEAAVVEAWRIALEREDIGIDSNFFAEGGDSIRAIRLVSELRRRGWRTELRSVFQNPTPERLAPRLAMATRAVARGPISGPLPLSPIQRWLFDALEGPAHFNQAVALRSATGFNPSAVAAALDAIWRRHDTLRASFDRDTAGIVQNIAPPGPASLLEVAPPGLELGGAATAIHANFSLTRGPLVKALLAEERSGASLLLAAHHAVVDAVSWRILVEDFATAYAQADRGEAPDLGPTHGTIAEYLAALDRLASEIDWQPRLRYWSAVTLPPGLPTDIDVPGLPVYGDAEQVAATLGGASLDGRPIGEELLLAAVAGGIARCFGARPVSVTLERHGREQPVDNAVEFPDLGRIVGWFTNFFPFALPELPDADIAAMPRLVKAALDAVPDGGRTYGLMTRHPAGPQFLARAGEIGFNHFGAFATGVGHSDLSVDWDPPGEAVGPDTPRPHSLDFASMIVDGALRLTLSYDRRRYRPATAQRLLDLTVSSLEELLSVWRPEPAEPAGRFTYSRLSETQLDQLLADD
jgi:amino acid adenylation domain-containing protein/non-ribosomal peptide synthase protein (TIGR01720 family)